MDHTESNGSTPFKFGPGPLAPSPSVQLRLIREWATESTEQAQAFTNWLNACLARHFSGDWGSAPDAVKALNDAVASDRALLAGGVIVGLHSIPTRLAGSTWGWLVLRSTGVRAHQSPTGLDLIVTEVLLLEDLV